MYKVKLLHTNSNSVIVRYEEHLCITQADIINLRPPNEESHQEDEQSEINGEEG